MIHGKIIKYNTRAYVPAYVTGNTMQMHLRIIENLALKQGDVIRIPLGIGFTLPSGHIIRLTSYEEHLQRLGLVLLGPNIIDSNTSTELTVVLANFGPRIIELHAGAPIVSMIIQAVEIIRLEVAYQPSKVSAKN